MTDKMKDVLGTMALVIEFEAIIVLTRMILGG